MLISNSHTAASDNFDVLLCHVRVNKMCFTSCQSIFVSSKYWNILFKCCSTKTTNQSLSYRKYIKSSQKS